MQQVYYPELPPENKGLMQKRKKKDHCFSLEKWADYRSVEKPGKSRKVEAHRYETPFHTREGSGQNHFTGTYPFRWKPG